MIYIDPAYLRTHFKHYPHKIEFTKWPDPIDGLPEALEKADTILFTHHHKDHCKRVTANRLRQAGTLVVGPERCKKELGKELKVIAPGEHITLGAIKIITVDAYNSQNGNSTKKLHRKGIGVGYLLHLPDNTIYHAGDTDFIPEMNTLEHVDVALLPIGGTYTMDIQEAVQAAITINPKIVIPIHHLKADPREFKNKVESKSDVKVLNLQIGEIYQLFNKR
jgi:L-ascorbate metabolism protein UlaG (beta-lactamase superfamily)